MASVTPLIAGNWKMNGIGAALGEIERLGALLAATPPRCTVVICPPTTLLSRLAGVAAVNGIVAGGQDCHPAPSGAHTGDVSAAMLADAGAKYVIVGHSERRTDHHETDALVLSKARAALGAGLVPIICVGETRAERESGQAEAVVASQLAGSVPDEAAAQDVGIAYEPGWGIGPGLTPPAAEIAQMHGTIRRLPGERFGGAPQRFPIL